MSPSSPAEPGSADRALLLIHGMGGNRHVWDGLLPLLAGRDVLAVDLAGHGEGARPARYTVGTLAAAVGDALDPDRAYDVLGHSLGGVIGLALATGWFGNDVGTVVAVGVKCVWSPEEVAAVRRLAAKPVTWFDRREDAEDRFVRAAGLAGLVAPSHPAVTAGVAPGPDGRWRTTVEPGVLGVSAPDMARLVAAARSRVVMARGEHDAMVSHADLLALVPDPVSLPGLGHSAHVEDPAAVLALLGDPS